MTTDDRDDGGGIVFAMAVFIIFPMFMVFSFSSKDKVDKNLITNESVFTIKSKAYQCKEVRVR